MIKALNGKSISQFNPTISTRNKTTGIEREKETKRSILLFQTKDKRFTEIPLHI